MTHKTHSILLFSLMTVAACGPKVPPELAGARDAYHNASVGPAAQVVPAELHKAHEALEDAELAFQEDPKSYHTKDLAYVALRKAQLADVLATQALDTKRTTASNAQYQSTQDAIMRDTRAELDSTQDALGSSQTDLAASQSATARTQEQLRASESARLLADQRTQQAMAALAKLAAVKEESRGLVITLSGSVLFRSDEATLLPEANTRLAQVSDALMATKERSILVEGHCDSQGSDAYNLELSQRRAEAVRTYLTSRGYDPALIRAVGVGEARPIADNSTDEGRANNRRVEIVVEPSPSASR